MSDSSIQRAKIDDDAAWNESSVGLCHHADPSCIFNAIRGLARGFIVGYGLRSLIGVITALLFKKIIKPRKILKSSFGSRNAVDFGVFLGLYNSLYKGTNCLLRNLRKKDDGWNAALAGAVAGTSMYFWKSSELALYLTSRAMECVFNALVEREYIKSWYWGDTLLFAVSCAFIYHAFMFEYLNLRPSYYSFVLKIVNGRELDRSPLKAKGFNVL